MNALVRERPPLPLGVLATPPSGSTRTMRAGASIALDVPQDIQFGTTIPGGFAEFSAQFARKSNVNYSDLKRLTDVLVYGVGGRVAWSGRLESAPRATDGQVIVSPGAVGWQAHLDDNKNARELIVDRDLTQWTEMPMARRAAQLASDDLGQMSLVPSPTSGIPRVITSLEGSWSRTGVAEAWYDSKGVGVGAIYVRSEFDGNTVNEADVNWSRIVYSATGENSGFVSLSGNLRGGGVVTATYAVAAARFVMLQIAYGIAGGTAGKTYDYPWGDLAVFGAHGLTRRGTAPLQGFYASDVIGYVVPKWAPKLMTTRAGVSTITSTAFVIPHLVFLDPTTASEMIAGANRFHLNDWAVWEDKTFWYYPRGQGPSRYWRARTAQAKLQENGPQVERLWNQVAVQYTDAAGATRTVGPVGSNVDTTDSQLTDADPENPATKLGITRCALLQMGTSTSAGAIEVGKWFLYYTKLLDTSGQATLTGWVDDDRGVTHPAWAPRAGDYISFVDSNDTSYRRVVRTNYSDSSKSNTLDLDSPPDGLQAILEQLQVVLVPIGISS